MGFGRKILATRAGTDRTLRKERQASAEAEEGKRMQRSVGAPYFCSTMRASYEEVIEAQRETLSIMWTRIEYDSLSEY